MPLLRFIGPSGSHRLRPRQSNFSIVTHVLVALLSFALQPSLTAAFAAETDARPNIVFIMVDDMGYGDLPTYGAKDVRTPHLDQIAAQGVRLTNYYAAGAECTPTRTALLSGLYPQRIGGMECVIGTGNVGRYDDAIRLRESHDLGLPADQSVLASSLKKAGY
jgi:arylsulfatase A-like enzyme